jgi:phospholipid N-methyltransferase
MTSEKSGYSAEEFVKEFNFEDCVLELLKSIENDNSEIKDILISKYKKMPISVGEEEALLDYFINNSVFSAATVANPATSVVTEFLYSRPKQPSFIDQYFFKSKGGMAIYSRLVKVEENLHDLIEVYLKYGKNILICNLGGGPGRDISDIFSKYYKNNPLVSAVNVDRDKMATKRGKRTAEANGIIDKIDFVDASFMRHKPKKKFDIILLVGVLCGLPPETCVAVLKAARKMMAKNGVIVASNVAPKMLEDDPFTYFIMEEITGWHLIFKSEELLKEIFKKAGLKWQKNFTDDFGFHNMGIATR